MGNQDDRSTAGWRISDLLSSPFRSFFFAGPLFGIVLVLTWIAATLGLLDPAVGTLPLPLWHGHEMLFGFAATMVSGFVLTALPGWAGTTELRGARLIILVVLWFAGRVPIFAAFFVGNVLFHAGRVLGELAWSGWGLRLALYALLLLFSFVGGLLAPVFTGNELRLRGRAAAAPLFNRPLEQLAVVTVLLYAATDLAGLGAAWCGAAALLALAVHALRMARWRTGAILDTPIGGPVRSSIHRSCGSCISVTPGCWWLSRCARRPT